MKNFDRYSKFSKENSGRSGGKDSKRFDRRDSRERSFKKQMHEVTCDKCGRRCEVPFKPTAGKPVYCSDCFREGKASSRYSERDSKRFERKDYNRSRDRDSSRFSRRDSVSNKPEQFIKEFEQINRKLDTILKTLEVSKKEQVAEKSVKEPQIKVEKKKSVKKVGEKKEQPKAKKKKPVAKKAVKKSITKKK